MFLGRRVIICSSSSCLCGNGAEVKGQGKASALCITANISWDKWDIVCLPFVWTKTLAGFTLQGKKRSWPKSSINMAMGRVCLSQTHLLYTCRGCLGLCASESLFTPSTAPATLFTRGNKSINKTLIINKLLATCILYWWIWGFNYPDALDWDWVLSVIWIFLLQSVSCHTLNRDNEQ